MYKCTGNQEARDALHGRAAGATVLLRGGDYTLIKPFVLSAVDCGTPGYPVTYASFPGEHAKLIGGIEIPSTSFHPSKMSVLFVCLSCMLYSFGCFVFDPDIIFARLQAVLQA